ncbi:MAG: ribosome biogenesis GTP-binding protein YihA/YsxC [Gammaproteobacteria bacterium]|nr:ribosome biogenesis GTP-binding protein YihA/YsxC [Gammaproteobacteria bacterium]MDH3374489.1 ribosome biogenesis GTP-binding protein YihA/YsxC [Gammaproteobacteria bacterium]MDH3552758.1 ribosome biogenesis GTP-binding protein YihA/YsxC [Gammaproteobacteria bacterium]
MSHYPEAQFMTSANARKQFVPDIGVEVAVAGRSNAGKSSAINVIVNRRQLARTSKMPGRTRLINFFSLRNGQRLVDLPGYGFARVADSMREHWGELLAEYFRSRQTLSGLLLIVDIRRQLKDYDRQMMAFAEDVDLPIHILLTKADKLKKGQASRALLEVRKEVGERATVQLFSALTKEGEKEAREVLERLLASRT